MSRSSSPAIGRPLRLEEITHATRKNPHPVMPLLRWARIFRPCSGARPSMRLGISPLVLLPPEEMAHAKRTAAGQREEIHWSAHLSHRVPGTSPSPSMRAVERAHRLLHPAQSVDRNLLELVQSAHSRDANCPLKPRWAVPALIRRGKQWWLHTPVEKTVPAAPPKLSTSHDQCSTPGSVQSI